MSLLAGLSQQGDSIAAHNADAAAHDGTLKAPIFRRFSTGAHLVVIGDSISAPNAGAEWPVQLLLNPELSGRYTLHNFAAAGQFYSYFIEGGACPPTTWCTPYAVGGDIKQTICCIFLGANDQANTTYGPLMSSRFDELATLARAAGQIVIAFTSLRRGGSYAIPQGEQYRKAYNEHLRISPLVDVLVDTERLFGAIDSPLLSGDQTHPSADGQKAIAIEVYRSLSANAARKDSDGGLGVLADGGNIAWDLLANPIAKVTLGGNRTLSNPTNAAEGRQYVLTVKQDGTGSRTLAFGGDYVGVPALTSTARKQDTLTFLCVDRRLVCIGAAQNVDAMDDKWLTRDTFDVDGELKGATPSPVRHWTNVWASAAAGSAGTKSAGALTVASGAIATVETNVANCVISSTMECSASTHFGLILRYVDDSNYLLLDSYHDTIIALYSVVGGSQSIITSRECTLSGNSKITATLNGSSIVVAVDGVTKITATTAYHVSATKHGVKSSGAGRHFDFTVAQL